MRAINSFFLTLIIYLGLPLLGWGLDDFYGFYSLPQMIGYSLSIVGFGLLVSRIIKHEGGTENRFGKGLENKFVPRQRIVRILVTAMLFCALLFVPFADRRSIGVMPENLLLRWMGLLLATVGMGVIFWSGWALGRFYSPEVTLQKEHRLITDGPFRTIRNPRYLGGIIQGVGLSLLFRSWIGLILTLMFFIAVIFRIKDEEALMNREFGEDWEAYSQKTWRLIPWLF